MYDQPPEFFRRVTSTIEKAMVFSRLQRSSLAGNEELDLLTQRTHGSRPVVSSTLVTQQLSSGMTVLRADRPAVVVSGTSWTADEDFSILLRAAVEVDRRAAAAEAEGRNAPHVVFIITGKGPLKEHYESEIRGLKMSHCHIVTAWLSADDYPALLGTNPLSYSHCALAKC